MINIGPKIKKPAVVAGALMLVFAAQAVVPVLSGHSSAASLTYVSVRFDRMVANTQTTGTVCAKPASTATEAGVKVTFPTGYTLGAYTTWTVDTTTNTASWPKDPADGTTAATTWPGISTPTNTGDFVVSGQSVTFPSSDLTAGTWYCFNWTNSAALKTSASPATDQTGSVTTRTSTPGDIDSSNYATATVSSDQVSVSATVNPTFSMALANTTDSLGTLSTSSIKSSSPAATMTVNTNAVNGWQAWGSSANHGLKSTTANYTITSNCSSNAGSNSTLSTNTEGYNLGVVATSGGGSTLTVDSIFDGTTSHTGGGLCANLQSLATSDGGATNAVLTLTNNASIAGSTPAANDYADTETFVAGGLF
jgi:hypothetical protein